MADTEFAPAMLVDYGLNDPDGFSGTVIDESNRPSPVEIGRRFMNTEIGTTTPWEAFDSEPIRIGGVSGYSDGLDVDPLVELGGDEDDIGMNTEIGGNVEIGALRQVIKTARDNRRPPPRMRAVDVGSPLRSQTSLTKVAGVMLGAAAAAGQDQYPLLSDLMLRAGADMEPRVVRVDTEESYKEFREGFSPDLSELRAKVDEISGRLDGHITDPYAHGGSISEAAATVSEIGADAAAAEQAKRLNIWLPPRYDGLIEAWREDESVCASLRLPGPDGEVRICTTLEPVRKCVEEMARHASEAGVPASTVLGVLPMMGCYLGAGTAIKEVAAAAPAILKRPEASRKEPFYVRIEPKASPALCALAALANECRKGNQQACDEWQRLASSSPSQVKQMMGEAMALVKGATA